MYAIVRNRWITGVNSTRDWIINCDDSSPLAMQFISSVRSHELYCINILNVQPFLNQIHVGLKLQKVVTQI